MTISMEEALNIITAYYDQSPSLAGDYKTKNHNDTAEEVLQWWNKIK